MANLISASQKQTLAQVGKNETAVQDNIQQQRQPTQYQQQISK